MKYWNILMIIYEILWGFARPGSMVSYSVYVCDVFQRHKGFIIIVFERQISILELYHHYNCYKPRKLICSWWGMTKRSDQQF